MLIDAIDLDDLVFAGEIGTKVQHALQELTPQERAAFLMSYNFV